eukprot:1183042-Prorocentrum_minimum.AAC.3
MSRIDEQSRCSLSDARIRKRKRLKQSSKTKRVDRSGESPEAETVGLERPCNNTDEGTFKAQSQTSLLK